MNNITKSGKKSRKGGGKWEVKRGKFSPLIHGEKRKAILNSKF